MVSCLALTTSIIAVCVSVKNNNQVVELSQSNKIERSHAYNDNNKVIINDIPDTGALVQIWITKIFNHGDISAATGEMSAEYAQPVIDQISEALNVLQTGLVVASLAAVVVSVLVNIFGDVIIIIFTSAAGAFLIAEGVSGLLEPGIEVFYAIVGAMILIGGTFQFFKKT